MAQAMGELIELATTGKSRDTGDLGTNLGTDRRNLADELSDEPILTGPRPPR
jgi:hypothetical protein